MWAHSLEGPGRLRKVSVPAPAASSLVDGQVIVRLRTATICGSDLPKFWGRNSHKRPIGQVGFPLHEVVGDVVESRDASLPEGTRVVGMSDADCAMSEFFVNSASRLIPLNPAIDVVHAPVIQPLATVLNAVDRLPSPCGLKVATIGQGPLGLLFSHVMSTAGASEVTGVDRVDRRDEARLFGVDRAVMESSDRWANDLADVDRPDLCIEAVGHQVATLNDAIEACVDGGHLFAFGVPDETHYALAIERMFRRNITLYTGATRKWRSYLQKSQQYLLDHPEFLATYLSDVFPIDEAESAFRLASIPAVGRLKVGLVTDGFGS